jgi:hypothetical protein
MIIKLLKLEALLGLVAVLMLYQGLHESWWWFLLVLVPDVSMVGYLQNSKTGAQLYNWGHSYVLPLLLLALATQVSGTGLVIASLLWLAHISMDRALGYGLKLPTGFTHTHLGEIGKKRT